MALLDLIARVKLFTRDYEAGLGRVERKTRQTGDRIVGAMKGRLAAAFSVTAIAAGAKSVLDYADNLGTLAQQADIGVEDLQRLNFVAASTSISVNEIVNSFKGLAKARLDALGGEAGNRKEGFFGQLGIGREELQQSNDLVGLFSRLSSEIGKIPQGAQRLALVQEIFSEAGVKILPVFNANMEELLRKFEQLGGPILADDIAALSEFNAALRQTGIAAKTVVAPALSDVANAIQKLTGSGGGNASSFANWWMEDVLPWIPSILSISRFINNIGSNESNLPVSYRHRRARAASDGGAGAAADPLFTDNRSRGHLSSDNLTAVGNFLGTANIQEKQLSTLSRVEAHVESIRQTCEAQVDRNVANAVANGIWP